MKLIIGDKQIEVEVHNESSLSEKTLDGLKKAGIEPFKLNGSDGNIYEAYLVDKNGLIYGKKQ